MKRLSFIIIFIAVFFVGINHIQAKDFKIYRQGSQGEYAVSGVTGNNLTNYSYYKYLTGEGNIAYCLDAHIQYGGDGTYKPALNADHTDNYYNYFLGTTSNKEKEFARGMISIGQEIVDSPEIYENEVYQQIALRLFFYAKEWNQDVDKSYSGGDGYYYAIKNANIDSLPGQIKTLYEKAAKESTYQTIDKNGSSFSEGYKNGFWERRYEKTKESKGLVAVSGGYTYDATWKTNIRSGGITCDNIAGLDNFNCEIISVPDPEIGSKFVDNIHIKSIGTITNPNFSFDVKYSDKREPTNFWQLFKEGYYGNWDGSQRMYVIDNEPSEFTITEGVEPEKNPEYDFCNVKLENKTCDASKGSEEFWVGNADVNQCILKQLDTTTTTNYATDNAKYGSKENEYCKIAVAEDYKFTMPTLKKANAGTYFKFNYSNGSEITSEDEIQISSRIISTSRIDLEKFYSEIYGNTTGAPSSETNYKLNARDALKYKIDDKKVSKVSDSYSGGLNQELLDFKILKEYLDILSNSSNYTTSRSSRCKTSGEYGCEEYYLDYKYNNSSKGIDVTIKEEKLESKLESIKKAKKDCNQKITTLKQNISAKVSNLNNCTDNVTEKSENLDPAIKYAYDEKIYSDKISIDMRNKKQKTLEVTNLYCASNLTYSNNQYSCGSPLDPKKQGISIGDESFTIYKNKQVAKITGKTNAYKTQPNFYTLASSGEVVSDASHANSNLLGNVIPVALSTPSGRHKYMFTFSNIGKYIKKSDKLTYTCFYDVTNDVTTPGKPNFFFRNVSLNNFDPNNRAKNNQLGKNWDTVKGRKTQCEIDKTSTFSDGKTCKDYSVDYSTQNEEIYEEDPEYSFTLTPDNMQKIKAYNKEKEKNGKGYSNFEMKKVELDGYEAGVWYTSDFINDSGECKNCFTDNRTSKTATWEKWDEKYEKLSGTGPAWK